MAHLFICPNCGNRSAATDRTAGFRNAPKGCSKCGFGFLFELLDDYYPAPERRVLRLRPAGPDHRLRPRLARADRPRRREGDRPPGPRGARPRLRRTRRIPSAPPSSGACASSASPSTVNAEGDLPANAVADLFPAYDDDGGLLLVLTPPK